MSSNLNETCTYFISLLRALVHEAEIPAASDGLDGCALYAVSEAQGLSCMVYHALYKLGLDRLGEQAEAMFRKAHKAYVTHSIMQELEFTRVSAALDSCGIDYIPLKGWYTRELYPEAVMRYMGDIDILVNDADRKKINSLLLPMGYTCSDFMVYDFDKYRKGRMELEMHSQLDKDGLKDSSLFDEPFELAKPVGGHCYRMTDDNAYIYTVAHGMKHFMNSGTGLRTLLDIYLYNKKCGIDKQYVLQFAEKLGIKKYLLTMETLAEKTFGQAKPLTGGELDSDSVTLLSFLLKSGAGGRQSTLDAALLDRSGKGGRGGSKLSYFWRMLFPAFATMKKRNPILKKAPILLPFMYIKRWFELIFKKRERLKAGLERYNAIEDKAVEDLRNIHRLAGLE